MCRLVLPGVCTGVGLQGKGVVVCLDRAVRPPDVSILDELMAVVVRCGNEGASWQSLRGRDVLG